MVLQVAISGTREGRLAGAVKVGNQWRVDRDALMAWVKEEGQPAKAEAAGGKQ